MIDLNLENLELLQNEKAQINGFSFYLLSSPNDIPDDFYFISKFSLESLIGDLLFEYDLQIINILIKSISALLNYDLEIESLIIDQNLYIDIFVNSINNRILLKENLTIQYIDKQNQLKDDLIYDPVYLSGEQLIEFVKILKLHNPNLKLSYHNNQYILKDFVLMNIDPNTLQIILDILDQNTI